MYKSSVGAVSGRRAQFEAARAFLSTQLIPCGRAWDHRYWGERGHCRIIVSRMFGEYEISTYEHGPRFTTNHPKKVPVWCGPKVLTSNIAVGWGPDEGMREYDVETM